MNNIRPAAVAGSFYPGNSVELSGVVDSLIANAKSTFSEPAKAYIVPHAGYQYSGEVAGEVYSKLAARSQTIRRVVLLGPCHRVWIRGLAVPSSDKFSTPLGEIELDSQSLVKISQFPQVQISDVAHKEEHSLEVQLPFIQRALDKVKLVPIAVGDTSVDEVSQVIEALWGEDDTIFLISSDLSHFHDYDTALETDKITTALIENFDYKLMDHEMACGSTPIQGFLKIAKKKSMRVKTLRQCNSGDTAGNKNSVVGYAAYAIY